jgi:hypothetical protein
VVPQLSSEEEKEGFFTAPSSVKYNDWVTLNSSIPLLFGAAETELTVKKLHLKLTHYVAEHYQKQSVSNQFQRTSPTLLMKRILIVSSNWESPQSIYNSSFHILPLFCILCRAHSAFGFVHEISQGKPEPYLDDGCLWLP